jgi:hypothetical protein
MTATLPSSRISASSRRRSQRGGPVYHFATPQQALTKLCQLVRLHKPGVKHEFTFRQVSAYRLPRRAQGGWNGKAAIGGGSQTQLIMPHLAATTHEQVR